MSCWVDPIEPQVLGDAIFIVAGRDFFARQRAIFGRLYDTLLAGHRAAQPVAGGPRA
jgi:hypothetical protein